MTPCAPRACASSDGDRAPDNIAVLYRAMQYASNLNLTFALRGTCRP
ncbi:MAG: hypothetical protein ACLT8E_01035 [Akkermansia sp.]